MAILQEIPLQAVINQSITTNINNQSIGITLRPLTVNNKKLYNNTPEYQAQVITFDTTDPEEATLPSSIYMVADITLNGTPIIYNSFCSNGVYLNPFVSNLVGYLFFYVDTWQTGDDAISYLNFNNGTTHLYYTDYDALQSNFNSFVQNNITELTLKYFYDYTA